MSEQDCAVVFDQIHVVDTWADSSQSQMGSHYRAWKAGKCQKSIDATLA